MHGTEVKSKERSTARNATNGAMTPSVAKRIIKIQLTEHEIEHPGEELSYGYLRRLVSGLTDTQFQQAMNDFKSDTHFTGRRKMIRYRGPPIDVAKLRELPYRILENSIQAAIFFAIKGGINTRSELARMFGTKTADNALSWLKRKGVIAGSIHYSIEIAETSASINGKVPRAKPHTLIPTLLAILKRHASEREVPYSIIIEPLVQQGFNRASIYTRLKMLKDKGLIKGKGGMALYAGEKVYSGGEFLIRKTKGYSLEPISFFTLFGEMVIYIIDGEAFVGQYKGDNGNGLLKVGPIDPKDTDAVLQYIERFGLRRSLLRGYAGPITVLDLVVDKRQQRLDDILYHTKEALAQRYESSGVPVSAEDILGDVSSHYPLSDIDIVRALQTLETIGEAKRIGNGKSKSYIPI